MTSSDCAFYIEFWTNRYTGNFVVRSQTMTESDEGKYFTFSVGGTEGSTCSPYVPPYFPPPYYA